jgi:hypothetical protein
MSLNNFYKLRKNFILLGLTGKMRSGSDLIVKQLSQEKLGEEQIEFHLFSSLTLMKKYLL